MLKVAVLIVGLCCIAAVQSRYTWKCPKLQESPKVDFKQVEGTWYVYGVNPSRWSMCYNYTVTATDNKFEVTENYFRTLIHTKATTDYELVFNDAFNKITLKHKVWKFIPTSETWKIMGSSMSDSKSWMVLYRCSFFKEESQIWVKDPTLYKDNGDGSEPFQAAVNQIGFNVSDYQIREKSDCNH